MIVNKKHLRDRIKEAAGKVQATHGDLQEDLKKGG
jgi:hypothetical protein